MENLSADELRVLGLDVRDVWIYFKFGAEKCTVRQLIDKDDLATLFVQERLVQLGDDVDIDGTHYPEYTIVTDLDESKKYERFVLIGGFLGR